MRSYFVGSIKPFIIMEPFIVWSHAQYVYVSIWVGGWTSHVH